MLGVDVWLLGGWDGVIGMAEGGGSYVPWYDLSMVADASVF